MPAQELLSDTDTQNGLSEVSDDSIQLTFFQIAHTVAGFSLSGEEHAVGFHQLFRIVCQQGFHTQPPQCVDDGIDVSGIIFNNGYIHYSYTPYSFTP
jgi:hypothetical protein